MNTENKLTLLKTKIDNMKKDGKYTLLFLSSFGSMHRLELKSDDMINSMLIFLIAKGY